VALLTLFSSLLAVVYVWRVVEAAYFQEPPQGSPGEPGAPGAEAPLSMLVPAWVLLGATLVFGVYTSLPVGVAGQAAKILLRGEP
jgi:multicomponent Na+:H+ antiporter subunit D